MINVRNVRPEDFELLYKWANDEDLRKQSFKSDKLELDQHKIWFDKTQTLYPLGYPYAFVANQFHQYILIFRKEEIES